MKNEYKKQKALSPYRFAAITAFTAFGISIIIDTLRGIDNPNCIIPYIHIVTYIVNFSMMIACVFVIIFPDHKKAFLIPMILESFFTVSIGYEFLGIILYGFCLLMLFSWGFFIHRFKIKVIISAALWILVLLTLLPYGIYRFFFAFGFSLFNFSTYVCIYSALYSKLRHLIPDFTLNSQKGEKKLPAPGSILSFKEYSFTERQVMCIYLIMQGTSSYKAIADKLAISVSVIKKEMLEIYHFFGVKNREMLYLMLSQYNPVYPDYVEKLKD